MVTFRRYINRITTYPKFTPTNKKYIYNKRIFIIQSRENIYFPFSSPVSTGREELSGGGGGVGSALPLSPFKSISTVYLPWGGGGC